MTKTILDVRHKEATKYFLRGKHYCNLELPDYFDFNKILSVLFEKIGELKGLNSCCVGEKNIKNQEGVNYKLLRNKDGKFDWRPFQLIHPVLYVSLVKELTEEKTWKKIKDRFKLFSDNKNIECHSIPILEDENTTSTKGSVIKWWEEIEQQTIELSLEYEYILHTDITDCYGSIYTHSIAWALHDKEFIKKGKNRSNKNLIGNVIDNYLMCMNHGQTNGIPQGSVLMDFLAEMVLGYVDVKISAEIKKLKLNDYKILRYRDDYRIFSNSLETINIITKILTEVLIDLGMKLNTQKTKMTNEIIESGIKSDKWYWLTESNTNISQYSIQKHLLIIYKLSKKFPNSGSLAKALNGFYRNLKSMKGKKSDRQEVLVSIIVDIMYNNPRCIPTGTGILSVIFGKNEDKFSEVVEKICSKLNKKPHTGYLDIWLQRLTIPFNNTIDYKEKICRIISGDDLSLWESDRLIPPLEKEIKKHSIINQDKLNNSPKIIEEKEFNSFISYI